MSGDEKTERLVAEIPAELKRLAEADKRDIKEIVESALWSEFGGEKLGTLQRRLEEKKNRRAMVERERNERERELTELDKDIQALETRLENIEERESELWQEALDDLRFAESEYSDSIIIESTEADVSYYADELDMEKEAFAEEIKERYKND